MKARKIVARVSKRSLNPQTYQDHPVISYFSTLVHCGPDNISFDDWRLCRPLRIPELKSENLDGGLTQLTALLKLEHNKAKDLSWPAQTGAHLLKEEEEGGAMEKEWATERDNEKEQWGK